VMVSAVAHQPSIRWCASLGGSYGVRVSPDGAGGEVSNESGCEGDQQGRPPGGQQRAARGGQHGRIGDTALESGQTERGERGVGFRPLV
jgi:hypothetical protein